MLSPIFQSSFWQNQAPLVGKSHPLMLAYFLMKHLQSQNKPILYVQKDLVDCYHLEKMIRFFQPTAPIVILPDWDFNLYDRLSPSAEIVSQRIYALRMISFYQEHNISFILLTTYVGYCQKFRSLSHIQKNTVIAKTGKRVPIHKFSQFLTQNGYFRVQTVRETGEYAIRGDIVDIFPTGLQKPVRIDFFGDVIEKIKAFDILTQISEHVLDELVLTPISEILLTPKTIEHFRIHYRELAGGTIPTGDLFYGKITAGHYVQGMEGLLPVFDTQLYHLHDILPDAHCLIPQEFTPWLTEFHHELQEQYQQSKAIFPSIYPQDLYLDEAGFQEKITAITHKFLSPHDLPINHDVQNFPISFNPSFVSFRLDPTVNLFEKIYDICQQAQDKKKKIILFSRTEGSRERLQASLQEINQQGMYQDIASFSDLATLADQAIACAVLDYPHGFETEEYLLISEQEILGTKTIRKKRKAKKSDLFLLEAQGLMQGDYIVHHEYGIGRYLGLFPIQVDKVVHDCIQLEYAGGDKIYVPVENLDAITRYGNSFMDAPLDKLGSAAWQARKAKLKERISDIAHGLIDIAAKRLLQSGEVIRPVEELYEDFCQKFPYDETEDQLQAIEAVIDDLGSGRPMDRLICGDVGFGKTEIAMRAAFVAAAAGIQVAIIVPTTLLARQHYHNFSQRFAGQPLQISLLSRMVSAKQAEATKQGLKNGDVHIVIGTHALLNKHLEFKNLGLLIIDEEQHFGVTHKERLKHLKHQLHVLTLTATPIPRTLQLSLTGVRDLSLITTPPVDRLPIRTYVMPFEPVTIREALLREKYRGGQAFFVVPRLSDLPDVREFLENYVPECRFVVGHGQLTPAELENVMLDFHDRKYDILVATTIIESGIDIATANTMIVWRADMFGLAQLYQIRGRIGRSKLRSYAFLTTPKNKTLTDNADNRLKVLASLDSLGAGFTLASHDMDIRGSGNLLGEEQSGHIKEVGFELYQQMLEEAIDALKNDADKNGKDIYADNKSPQINIGISALIPENYVPDLGARLGLYRRISEFKTSEETSDFSVELRDRFGKIPQEVQHLFLIIQLKNLCKQAGIARLDAGEKGMVIGFYKDLCPYADKLFTWIAQQEGRAKLRPDSKLTISISMNHVAERFKKVRAILMQLVDLH